LSGQVVLTVGLPPGDLVLADVGRPDWCTLSPWECGVVECPWACPREQCGQVRPAGLPCPGRGRGPRCFAELPAAVGCERVQFRCRLAPVAVLVRGAAGGGAWFD
jgi:hypothetical protein